MEGSHSGELFLFRVEGLGRIGKELHSRIAAHTKATFLKKVTWTSQCPWKLNLPMGWCGRIAFWQMWQFSQYFFICLFSPSISWLWLLSLDSGSSPVSSCPCILSTSAAFLTWVKTWSKSSQQAQAFSNQSRIFSQGKKKSTCTYNFSYNFKMSWNPC